MPEEAKRADGMSAVIKDEPKARSLPDPSKIKGMWEKGVTRRAEVDREAWEAISFIAGRHYLVWDSSTRTFRRPVNDGRAKLRINLVKVFWRGEKATLLEGNPVPEVLPSSDSELDKQAATFGNQILEHEQRRLYFPLLRDELYSWRGSCGLAYLHPTWNKNLNKGQGDIQIEVVPMFEVVPDPAVRHSLTEGMWVIHNRHMTTEEAYEQFGKEFAPEQGIEVHNWGTMFSGSASFQQKPEDAVQVLRMWHKPSRRYPQGFVRTVVSGEVVEDKPFPYEHGELPFVDFHHIKLPGRFEGQSMVHDLIPPQRDYNQSRSRAAEIRSLMSAPGWLAPEGSMDVERMTTEPGEVKTYRVVGPYKPEPIQPPQAPQHLFQTMQSAYSEMQDIAGQHDVSRGVSPGSGTPASAIVALQEKDSRKLATTIRTDEVAWSRVGKQMLELVSQYWTTKRMVRVWSDEEGSSFAYFYKGSDLKDQTDVHIVPGSSEPKSKSQEQELLLTAFREGLISDPGPVLESLAIPGVRKLMRRMNSDLSQARREHDRIFEGEEVLAEGWHAHEVHITEHNEFRKSELFEAWPPEIRNALSDHIAEHEAILEQQMKEELAQQMAQQEMMTMAGSPQTGAAPAPTNPAGAMA